MDKLDKIRRLRDEYEAAMDEAERLRGEYHQAIDTLHRSGATLREIADGLGISHQRVHQIVSPSTTRSRSRARAASVGAALVVAFVLGGFAVRGASPDSDRASSPAAPSGESQRSIGSLDTVVRLNPRTGQILSGTVVMLDPNTGKILALQAPDLADILEGTPRK
jgi:hypothetical protein